MMAETNFAAMQIVALSRAFYTDDQIRGIYFCTPEEAYGERLPGGPPLIMFSSENVSEIAGFEQYITRNTVLQWLDEYPINHEYKVAHVDHLYQTLIELGATEPEIYYRFRV